MPWQTTAATALEYTGGYELSVLFLLFVGINIAWEALLALLRFFNDVAGGRGTLFIERVKEEVLGLGVISLVLVFVEPQLVKICIADDSHIEADVHTSGHSPASGHGSTHQEHNKHACPPGKENLFPKVVITASHYLLFYIAVVHIVYSFISFVLTLQRFRTWVRWEHEVRAHGPALTQPTADSFANDGKAIRDAPFGTGNTDAKAPSGKGSFRNAVGCCGRCLTATWVGFTGGVSQSQFLRLRKLFLAKAALSLMAESAADEMPQPPVLPEPGTTAAGSKTINLCKDVSPEHTVTTSLPSPFISGVDADSQTAESAQPTVPQLLPRAHLSATEAHALHSIHFANAAEQLVELELLRVWAHAWALALFTALFLLFPQQAWQAVWISGVALLFTLVATIKMHLVLHSAAQLGAHWSECLAATHDVPKKPRLLRKQHRGRRAARAASQQLPSEGQEQKPRSGDVEMGPAGSDPASNKAAIPARPNSRLSSPVAAAALPSPNPGATPLTAPSQPSRPSPATSLPSPAVHPPSPLPPPPATTYTFDSAAHTLDALGKRLLWFHHPLPLLWLINLVFVINSLSITLGVYFMVAYEGANLPDDWTSTFQTWVPVLIFDVLLAVYLGTVIVPQYALISASCGHSHASIMRELRAHKRASQESEQTGLSGLLLSGLFKLKHVCEACCWQQPASNLQPALKAGLSEDGEKLLEVFIRGLAARAGVILGHGSHGPPSRASHPLAVLPLYRQLAKEWVSKAAAAAKLDVDPSATLGTAETGVSQAIESLREAFALIDTDNSGAVTLPELRKRLKDILETKPTTNELRAMVHTIDADVNRQISMREMATFCAHDFMAVGSLHPGIIDAASLQQALHILGMPPACCTQELIKTLLASNTDAAGTVTVAVPQAPPGMTLHRFAALFGDFALLD